MTLRSRLAARSPPGYALKYYLFRATRAAGFTAPIWYLYILSNGVSYAQLGLIDAVWWAGLIVFEIPTGVIGDRIGRRNGLIVSSLMVIAAQLGMVLADAFPEFLLVFAWWAMAATFRTGTADAWLYDALANRVEEDQFARVKGRGSSVALVVTGTTALAGGYITEVNMAYAYLASAGVTALSIPVLLSFPRTQGGGSGDPDGDSGGSDGDADDEFTVLDALPVIRSTFSQRPLRTFLPYVALFTGAFWGVNFFVQPVSVELGLSERHLGWLFASFTFLGAGASYAAGWLEETVGVRRWFTAIPPLLGVAFLAVAFVPMLAIPVFVAMRVLRKAGMPLANQFINDRVDSVGRATALSSAGMVFHLVTIPFELSAGALGSLLSPLETIGVFGGVLAVGAVVILGVREPFGSTAESSLNVEVPESSP
jgi:MFS family permease